jgi:hypothetical protein
LAENGSANFTAIYHMSIACVSRIPEIAYPDERADPAIGNQRRRAKSSTYCD